LFYLRRFKVPGPKPVVVVGSINTDLVSVTERIPHVGETVLGSDFRIHPGGKGANQAVAVARLGHPVRMIGRVGTDSFGREARLHLEKAGVDTECVGTSEGSSGIAVICVSAKGENSIIVTPGANWNVSPHDLEDDLPVIRSAGIVLAQLEIPMETIEYLAQICAREGIPFLLDPAPACELPEGIFKHIAWFTPNQTEATFFTHGAGNVEAFDAQAVARKLLQKGYRGVVLKMGEDGALVACSDGSVTPLPAFDVTAIDTTAAGDAFNGGFAVGLMKGMKPEESARFAGAVAGFSVTRRGAQPSMPTLKEVEQFIAEHAARVV
jgi:ribokinase